MSPSRVAWIASCIADASAATRSAGAVAGRRPVDAGLTGSRCWLLQRPALRLWLRRLSRCQRLLILRLLSYAVLGERIVVNGNERVVIEIRLIVYRHQRVIRHDESPTGICGHLRMARDVTAPSRRGLGWL